MFPEIDPGIKRPAVVFPGPLGRVMFAEVRSGVMVMLEEVAFESEPLPNRME